MGFYLENMDIHRWRCDTCDTNYCSSDALRMEIELSDGTNRIIGICKIFEQFPMQTKNLSVGLFSPFSTAYHA